MATRKVTDPLAVFNTPRSFKHALKLGYVVADESSVEVSPTKMKGDLLLERETMIDGRFFIQQVRVPFISHYATGRPVAVRAAQ